MALESLRLMQCSNQVAQTNGIHRMQARQTSIVHLCLQPYPDGSCMSLEAFAVCQCSNDGTQFFEPLLGDFLGSDVLLE